MTRRRPGPFGPGSVAGPDGPALQLTAAWVATAMAGDVVGGDTASEFGGVSIDTRTVAPGELFVAIRGERFDGAQFAPAAIESGAAGVVVPRGWSARNRRESDRRATLRRAQGRPEQRRGAKASAERGREPVVIEVDDTTAALQALGRAVRRASGSKVVAITGSTGKTTTKEIAAEFLAARYRVMRNRGNFNNHIGLPLSLIELAQRPEIAVVELGMNHAGEISTLVGVAEPDVRVWTNVGDAHLGFFASLEAIADAKAEVLEGATASTLLIANADDDRVMARVARFPGRTVTFGIDRDADVRASSIANRGIDGLGARVTTARGSEAITTPLVGLGNLANVLAAAAVATELGVPMDEVAARAATLRPSPHRGEVVRLPGGVTVLDDSYNANPAATLRALDVLAHAEATRRIAVLGEMLELGDHALARHQDVGRAAARARVDVLFAVGGAAARARAAAAVEAGMAGSNVRYAATSDEAAPAVVEAVTSGDLVLVKGSRGVETDRVVERLKAERA